jgi:hypothetical protein
MRTYRLQIDVPENKYAELEALIKECGFATKKEFFDNAVTLFKWAVGQARRGNSIAAVDERAGKFTELQMPFLEHVKPAVQYVQQQQGAAD